jgi:hypothetical protein
MRRITAPISSGVVRVYSEGVAARAGAAVRPLARAARGFSTAGGTSTS